jgi:hypothetical protein
MHHDVLFTVLAWLLSAQITTYVAALPWVHQARHSPLAPGLLPDEAHPHIKHPQPGHGACDQQRPAGTHVGPGWTSQAQYVAMLQV